MQRLACVALVAESDNLLLNFRNLGNYVSATRTQVGTSDPIKYSIADGQEATPLFTASDIIASTMVYGLLWRYLVWGETNNIIVHCMIQFKVVYFIYTIDDVCIYRPIIYTCPGRHSSY